MTYSRNIDYLNLELFESKKRKPKIKVLCHLAQHENDFAEGKSLHCLHTSVASQVSLDDRVKSIVKQNNSHIDLVINLAKSVETDFKDLRKKSEKYSSDLKKSVEALREVCLRSEKQLANIPTPKDEVFIKTKIALLGSNTSYLKTAIDRIEEQIAPSKIPDLKPHEEAFRQIDRNLQNLLRRYEEPSHSFIISP